LAPRVTALGAGRSAAQDGSSRSPPGASTRAGDPKTTVTGVEPDTRRLGKSRLRDMSSSRLHRALALLALVVYLALALHLGRVLYTWDDESAYVALGRLATTGELSLYQDDMTGQRMPLPFYVEGASQVIFGRNLWAARLFSLVIGIGALVLTVAVA